MITLIGICSPEEKKSFEEFARKAIKEYPELKQRVKFLEVKCELYENKEFGKYKK